MQRLYSAFPASWPGAGLLLLRVTAGGATLAEGVGAVGGAAAGSWPWLGGLLMIVAGACLVLGFATPVAGILAAATCVLAAVLVGTSAAAPYVCIMAAVVVLLGPGAWSVDARRYGRRQVMIVVTPSPPTSKQVPGPDPAEVSEDPSKP